MATTFVDYTGDGNATKSFSFPSYKVEDIKVKVDDVVKTVSTHYNITSYTTTGGGNVVFTSGNIPDSPADIHIYRDTDVDSAKATYTAGSSVKAGDLNNNHTQLLYALQEEQNQLVRSGNIKDAAVITSKIKDLNVTTAKLADSSVTTAKIADSNVTTAKIADNAVTLAKLNSGALPTDITVASANIVDGTIVEADLANSAVTSNKIAANAVTTTEILNGAVTTAKINADAITGAKIADNAIDTEHIADNAIITQFIADNAVTSNKIADDAVTTGKLADGAVNAARLAANAVTETKIADGEVTGAKLNNGAVNTLKIADNAVTINKIADAAIVTNSEQASHSVDDNTFFTTSAAEARYFNVSSGETIKDGDTFPDNDTTIATTAAINDRIIDIVNDVGGFVIVESEQHFPNSNPQGQAGSAAVLSIKAASGNLVPSGTTLTITNGNIADNADITITGVTATIPSGFGFIVESTNTLHTYTFHRLVPKATEVTTVAGKAVEIGRLGTADAVADMALLGTTDVVADLNTLGTADVVSDMNALAVSDVISDMNTLAVTDVINDMDTVAGAVTNVNNVGNNITNVNSVTNSAGSNQTFVVTVQNVSGNKYFIDSVQTPVLKLARGKTYTFNMADSSNSSHPLAFRDSSDNSYTTGVTTSGTAGSSGATVVIVVAANAPSSLKYYCTSHGNSMGNTITVIDDNVGTVAGSIGNVNTVGAAISNVNTTATNIASVNTTASNISNVNNFTDKYQIASNNPSTDGGGNALAAGDLYFNTSANELKVYNGSAWQGGVTASGSFASTTGNTFTGDNRYNDGVKALFGTGSDFEIFFNGTNTSLYTGTGDINIQTAGDDIKLLANDDIKLLVAGGVETSVNSIGHGATEIYYDNVLKLNTKSDGVLVSGELQATHIEATGSSTFSGDVYHGDNVKARFGAGSDLQIYHDGTNSYLQNNTGELFIRGNGDDIHLKPVNTEDSLICRPNGAVELYFNGTKRFETSSSGVLTKGDLSIRNSGNTEHILYDESDGALEFVDSIKATFGNGSDLQIFHDGSDSWIRDTGTGMLRVDGSQIQFRKYGTSEVMANFIQDGAVELFHNNVKKFETTSDGVTVNGHSDLADDNRARFGTGNDLNVYHTSNQNYIEVPNAGTGNLNIITNGGKSIFIKSGNNVTGSNNAVVCNNNSSVDLYHSGSKKFETHSEGARVHGIFRAIGAEGVDGKILIQADDGDDPDDFTRFRHGADGYFYIENYSSGSYETALRSNGDGAVELYFDNSKKLETVTGGINVVGALTVNGSAINTDLVSDTSPQLGGDLDFNGNNALLQGAGGNVNTNWDNDAWEKIVFDASYNNAAQGPNKIVLQNDTNWKAGFGVSANELGVYSGANIAFYGLTTDSTASTKETFAKFTANGAVDLYYNNVKKFETNSGGCTLTGTLTTTSGINAGNNISMADNVKLKAGTGDDLQIFHNGSHNYFYSYYGNLEFRNAYNGADERMIKAAPNAEVELYFDGSPKLETIAGGISVTGGINTSAASTFNQSTFNSGAGAVTIAGNSDIRFTNGGWTGESTKITHHANYLYLQGGSNGIQFRSSGGTDRLLINSDGHLLSGGNNTYDLGSTSNRWRNIYTNDLNLSNEGSSNDVDGSWGNWTIQEGESDLFLKNNRSGKKYKFNLTEVS